IVGRDAELAALQAIYNESRALGAARLATVIGDAGVGKSRLVHEVLEQAAPGAWVLRGRCLPYGDGITFWPLVGMLTQAAGIHADDPPEVARAKVLAAVGQADVADRLASAVGLSTATFPLIELYWAARKFLEGLAAQRPVVALLDDIHWAEPAFLDLIEHILGASSGAPILMLATARHDLLEERPEWGERAGSIRLVLRPLSDDAAAHVVANLLGAAGLTQEVIDRIVDAAEGNPLFVEQMLSMLIDTGALRLEGGRWVRAERYGEITVPPTIQALLEARIDRLNREERAAVDPASVIGLEFAQPAVEALAPNAVRASLDRYLAALTHKQFIRPAPSPGQPEVRFRFGHHLVRETVYNGLLKRARATLHADFVRWADGINAERDRGLEFEEILGYHLEQAHRYLSELGTQDDAVLAIGVDAARRLGRAGRRAFARSDMAAAANLVQRATALLPTQHPHRLELLPLLAEALMERGDFKAAREVLAEAAEAADHLGDARLQSGARLVRMLVRLYSAEAGEWSSEALRFAHESLPALEALDAHNELATAWRLIAIVHGVAGRYGEVVKASEQVLTHARLAGNDRLVSRTRMGLATSALLGPTPVCEAITQCDRLIADGLSDRQVESSILCTLAQLRAMNGEFDEARRLVRRGRSVLRDLGQGVRAASTGIALARVELLAGGDLATAEREVRLDCDFLVSVGETYFLSTVAAFLARIVRQQGRDADALALSKIAEDAAAEDDVDAQILWRSVRAPILARQGDLVAAEALAGSALELAAQTEDPVCRADALSELAAVLAIAGRTDEALQRVSEAFAVYSAKGDVVSAARVRSLPVEDHPMAPPPR
ncbi:MAG TPA: AAA family ATPase, partial [Burkholderiaceae bacterium]|nr:AAA family ATPase [Burkholderiaceae bacterium]